MSNLALELKNVEYAYRRDVALRGVSLRVHTGEVVAVTAIGLLSGGMVGLQRMFTYDTAGNLPSIYLASLGGAIAGAALTWLGSALAGYLLRHQLDDALDPENLRAA